MSVFVDTSALYALLVRSESRHRDVLQTFEKIVGEATPMVTTSYCLVETITLLQHRVGLAPVRDFDTHIVPLLTIEWVTKALHQKGTKRLIQDERRKLSLVDAVSFEVMNSKGIVRALTLDIHFQEAGFDVSPEPPPSNRSAL